MCLTSTPLWLELLRSGKNPNLPENRQPCWRNCLRLRSATNPIGQRKRISRQTRDMAIPLCTERPLRRWIVKERHALFL